MVKRLGGGYRPGGGGAMGAVGAGLQGYTHGNPFDGGCLESGLDRPRTPHPSTTNGFPHAQQQQATAQGQSAIVQGRYATAQGLDMIA